MFRNDKISPDNFWVQVALGVVLLVLVFFSPDAGHARGTSFISVAVQSRWSQVGDWAAAWCSIKILLLTVGSFLVTQGLFILLETWKPKQEMLSLLLALVVVFATMGGGLTGLYLLAKAIL